MKLTILLILASIVLSGCAALQGTSVTVRHSSGISVTGGYSK